MLERNRFSEIVCRELHIDAPAPDMTEWDAMLESIRSRSHRVTIGLVGKYVQLHDAYLSVAEALRHAGVANDAMWRSTGSTPRPSRRRTSAKFWAICPASSSPAASQPRHRRHDRIHPLCP